MPATIYRQRWHMYTVVAACAVGYLPARILHRGYDASADRFSFRQLFSPQTAAPRVDPHLQRRLSYWLVDKVGRPLSVMVGVQLPHKPLRAAIAAC